MEAVKANGALGVEGAPAGNMSIALASFLLVLITLLILYLKPKSNVPSSKSVVVKRSLSVAEEDLNKPSVRILYGTQTGTAERFAKQLGNEIRRKYGDSTLVEVIDIENYKAESRLPKEKLVLYLMATYGDGEPTDNAADFYNWVCSEVEDVENGVKDQYLQVCGYRVMLVSSSASLHPCMCLYRPPGAYVSTAWCLLLQSAEPAALC